MHPTLQQFYQAGGSLPVSAPSYVKRQADTTLYDALKAGQFCYILNARQMGKSSLRVQMMARLEREEVAVGAIDMTLIGSQQMTIEQWYASVLHGIVSSFRLTVNLRQWWRDRQHLSTVKRFDDFLETVLLAEIATPLVIFIDEIDSVLGLDFPLDDFFALIRACYNRRVENPHYQRLTFALFGVTTPSDLIRDRNRTPFNIGQAIALQGFSVSEALPLVTGLQGITPCPERMLKHILKWTGGQPFLTQKLCHLVQQSWPRGTSAIDANAETAWLDNLVQTHLLSYWELQDEPEHLRTIANRLLADPQKAGRLLGLYQQMITSPQQAIAIDHSLEQIELLLSGLVVKEHGQLKVRNPIYAAVFNQTWLEDQLNLLRPYAENLKEWLNAECQDESRLLQGKALTAAEDWAHGKRLDDQDYQFLAASHALSQRKQQQALEAARTQEMEARLVQEHKAVKLQRGLLSVAVAALGITTSLGIYAKQQSDSARVGQIQALIRSSEALYAANQRFDSLVEALRARQEWRQFGALPASLEDLLAKTLQAAVYGVVEANRLTEHQAFLFGIAFSPDGQHVATASDDKTIKLWRRDGTLVRTLAAEYGVFTVAFSPDGQGIAATNKAGQVKFWNVQGELMWVWDANPDSDYVALHFSIAFSPDGHWLAVTSEDKTVELLRTADGQKIRSFTGHQDIVWGAAFSPDGQYVASASQDQTIKLWRLDGQLVRTFTGHGDRVTAVRFRPDGQQLASLDIQGVLKLWDTQGNLLRTIDAHEKPGWDLVYSPDGQRIVTSSEDRTLRIWNQDGDLLQTLDHGETVFRVAMSPDGEWLASAGADNLAKLWRLRHPFVKTLHGHRANVIWLRFSPQGDRLASPSWDNTVKVWDRDGHLLTTFTGHHAPVSSVAFHPDGQRLASLDGHSLVSIWRPDGQPLHQFSLIAPTPQSHDKQATDYVETTTLDFSPNGQHLAVSTLGLNDIQLRQPDGRLLKTLSGHQAGISQVRYGHDGHYLVSGSIDGTVKLWQSTGELVRTFVSDQEAVWGVAISPDGQWVASGGDDTTVKLWRVADGQLMQTMAGHTQKIYSVEFSPDGNTIASAGRDGNIKLWDRQGNLITSIPAHDQVIMGATFSPDGKWLASSSWDKTLKLWQWQALIALEPIEQMGCDWLADYLKTHPDPSLCVGINPTP